MKGFKQLYKKNGKRMKAVPGQTGSPELIGRSDQLDPVDTLITDMAGIVNAAKLFSKIEVSVNR